MIYFTIRIINIFIILLNIIRNNSLEYESCNKFKQKHFIKRTTQIFITNKIN